ncbi:MAG: hypothetical protein JO301_15940 [Chitinophagaceae bacterium]|nr:hypothetical protein [Chitinophagaceae bacterium]
MRSRYYHIMAVCCAALLLGSCATRKIFSTNYYHQNEKVLTDIEHSYRAMYGKRPFSLEFTDKSFNNISLEIITDSVKLIYDFEVHEARLQDTMQKYRLPAEIHQLIEQMKSIRCIWINMLDYYTNNRRETLVFMSIRNVAIHLPFTPEKYYILTFYAQLQYYDSEGRLLAGRNLRRVRKINDEIFMRITDKVCYTISGRFR